MRLVLSDLQAPGPDDPFIYAAHLFLAGNVDYAVHASRSDLISPPCTALLSHSLSLSSNLATKTGCIVKAREYTTEKPLKHQIQEMSMYHSRKKVWTFITSD